MRLEKFQCRKSVAMMLVLLCIFFALLPYKVNAAITGQETEVMLLDTRVGRYRVSYTGNTNHYTWYSPNGGAIDKKIYNDLGGYANSSVANLERSTDTSKIKCSGQAFL